MLLSVRGPRKISVGERTMHTAFNQTGRRRELKSSMFVNGYKLVERFLHDDEIDMLHQLKPGHYLNRKVLVQQRERIGGNELHIFYSNKTVEQRMEMKGIAANFRIMLQKIIEEQKTPQLATA